MSEETNIPILNYFLNASFVGGFCTVTRDYMVDDP